MAETFILAALWLSLAVFATIVANHLKVSMALVEICVGIVAGIVAERFIGPGALGADAPWLRFPAASGAVVPNAGGHPCVRALSPDAASA